MGILTYIFCAWTRLESRSGVLRPRLKPAEDLIRILEDEDYSQCPRFSECERATDRNCLLDACVDLLTPFGLHSDEASEEKVTFAHPILTRVEITRFYGYVPPEHQVKLDVIWASCVVVTGLHTDNID